MGRKRNGQRQHFYFCLALLIFVAGCSLIQESNRRREMREALATGNDLLIRGDFDGSIESYQNVLEKAQGKPPADVASYQMGLTYAHPDNPNRDLEKALNSFSSVASDYPQSPWAEQARVWVGVLKQAQESQREIAKSRQAIERSKQEIERNRAAIERSKQEIDKSRAELEKTKQEIEKSRQVIEKSKQVDIEIDQKRRDRRR